MVKVVTMSRKVEYIVEGERYELPECKVPSFYHDSCLVQLCAADYKENILVESEQDLMPWLDGDRCLFNVLVDGKSIGMFNIVLDAKYSYIARKVEC